MEWFFGPTIPSWNIVLQCLPKEYKDRNVVSGDKAQLFDENVTEGTSQDPTSKINILLTKRQLFFSEEGYLTQNEWGVPSRTWARLHYDANNQPNGMVFCTMSSDFFMLWKGQSLCSETQVQRVFYMGDAIKVENCVSFADFFPLTLENHLNDTPLQDRNVRVLCDIQEAKITSTVIKAVKDLCGTARVPLPPNIEKHVFATSTESFSSRMAPYIVATFVILGLATFFFSFRKRVDINGMQE